MWKSKRPPNIIITNNFMFDSKEETQVIGFTYNQNVRNLKIKESQKESDDDFFQFSKNCNFMFSCMTPQKITEEIFFM